MLLLAGLYALLGFYAAPRIVRSQAIDFVRENYGRELTLGEIRINPFKLQAEIKDLSLPDTDGKPMLAFRRLFIDFELSSLWRRAYFFKDVQLDAPLARAVIRPDGSVNLADLALPDDGEPDEPLPRVWIQQFALGDGRLQFADLTRRVPLERQFTPVNFKLDNFKTTPEGGAFGLTAKTQNAELLEWHGKFALEPQVSSSGELAVTSLNVPGALEVAGVELPFVIPQGEMNLRGSYERRAERAHASRRAPAADAAERPDACVHGVSSRTTSPCRLSSSATRRSRCRPIPCPSARLRLKASRPTSGRCPTAR